MTKKRKPLLDPPYLDEEERDIIESFNRGEWKPVKNQEEIKLGLEEAARNYFRKDARINIRLSSADLLMIKRRAAREGIPYQTLVASILHKYATGQLSSVES